MGAYIDRDELLELYANTDDLDVSNYDVKVAVIRQNILDMPTIDITRCGECKYHDEDGWGYGNCQRPFVEYLRMADDDFCSRAKVKVDRGEFQPVEYTIRAKSGTVSFEGHIDSD